MKKILLIIFLFFTVYFSFSQAKVALDPLAAEYFTSAQIDTMSHTFIKVQNYIVRYSWNLYGRWDKNRTETVEFNRDTVDIRPFLKVRKQDKPKRIYDAYPGLVLELDSKNSVDFHVKRILAGEE